MTGAQGEEYAEAQRAWREARLSPLWESTVAFVRPPAPPKPLFWKWSAMRPLIERAIALVSPEHIERRVLLFTDPELNASNRATTTRGLNAGLQILLPGETARPHRHSMDAIRFVLEGEGATTTVDGKVCPMAEGDLVITPGGCWHEHTHRGDRPIIWLDGLNSPLHRYLGTATYEAGPPPHLPATTPDAAFASANILPDMGGTAPLHSPVFRYPYAAAVAALAAAPRGRDGARRVRYVNPATGGSAIALLDHYLVQLDAKAETIPFRSTAHAICTVVEGEGESTIGDQIFAWGPRDIFTLPPGNWIVHRNGAAASRLFIFTDREMFARLGLLKEDFNS